MTESAHPPEYQSIPLPPATAAELLTRITAQLGTQLSGLRPRHGPGARHHGVHACTPPSSPWPTAAATLVPCPPSRPCSNGSVSSAPGSTSGWGTSS